MKKISFIAFIAVLFSSSSAVFCQFANLEFIENKGQWDKKIKFKGVMNDGAFYLLEKGFKVVQHKAADLEKLENFVHGFSNTTPANSAARQSEQPSAGEAGHSQSGKPEHDQTGVTVHSHAYDVEFINASTPTAKGDKPLTSYNNYFIGNDASKWKSNCKIFQAVTYNNIYKNIDVRYYTNEGHLKYDLLLLPNADITQIAMKYNGVEELVVKNEQLVIKTSIGEIHELAPYAYQIINGQKQEIKCRFVVVGKTVRFAIDQYAKNETLVIDPTLIFSTFTGSTADNWGYTATYGPDGSFYAGGIVFGSGFPISTGAYQSTFNGGGGDEEGVLGYDIGIMKFSPNGNNRTYATYIGGSGNEQPHSLVVNGQGELFIAGRTNSLNYPVTVPNLGPCIGYDIILTKLNATGSVLVASRKIGGSGRDGVNIRPKFNLPTGVSSIRRNYGDDARSELILDNTGNILLASNTQSKDFPTANAIQNTLAGGADNQDGVILKATADLKNILFSTYLGGKGNDAAFVIAQNPIDNNIYIGGNTVSTDFPGDKSGVINPSFMGGETDGFISIISNDGSRLIKTSYMGTDGSDMLYGIQFDKFGFPYIMGTSTGNWPVTNAAFSQPGGRQFISKLKPDLSAYEYSTVFGTPNSFAPNISPVAFLVDRCENVYVSGWGGMVNTKANYPSSGTSGLRVTAGPIQATTDNNDFYFFVLEKNAASQLYGSFYGQSGGFGEHVDGGTSRFDRNGVIYQAICANCNRDVPFPTTPGVWSPTNGSTGCNLAAVKIAFNLSGVIGSVRPSIQGKINDSSGCVPLKVDFTDTLAEGKKYLWNFGDGTPGIETTTPTISHTFNNVGNYRVRLISVDSAKCNTSDTAYTNIRVKTDKGILDFATKKLSPPCNSFNYQFTNNSFVTPAGRKFAKNSFIWDFGDQSPRITTGLDTIRHSFPAPGVYKVRLVLLDTNFCNAPDSLERTLRVASNVKASFKIPAEGCAPFNALFDNTSSGGQQFFWDLGDGSTSTEVSPVHLYSTPGTYKIKLTAIDSSTCNFEDSTSFTIIVSDKPIASFNFTPDPPQENTPVRFSNSSIGATRFQWRFGDGDTLATRSLATVSHIYNETKLYNACLVAYNNTGCPDTTCKNLQARISPLLDVPNAFTPNGDGINDKVFVRGFGIIKMTWRIYNRWGNLVFETNDRTAGWDGTYKGSIQPSEVYHYVLDVSYADNSTFQKKGDITLLR